LRLVVEAGLIARPGGELYEDAAILIEDGIIAAIDRRASLANVEADRIGGPECLALPGLVNAHQHGRAESTVAVGALDSPLECWLVSLLATPDSDPYNDTVRLCRRLVVSGTTTAVHSHHSTARTLEEYDTELRALLAGYRDSGVRGIVAADLRDQGVPVFGDVHRFMEGLPADLRDRAHKLQAPALPVDGMLEVVGGLRAETRTGRLGDVDVIYGPPGPPWCSASLLERIASASQADDVPVHMHLLETWYEREFGLRSGATGSVDALANVGLLTHRLFVAHGVWLDKRECEALANSGTSVVTNPGSNLRLHAGVAPIRALLAAGVNVALGTDNMALGDREEILDELRLVRALQRHPGVDESGITAPTLLALVSQNGGRALGRTDVGVLRANAVGDVVLVDMTQLAHPPIRVDPLELTLATARSVDLRAVIARGQVIATTGQAIGPPVTQLSTAPMGQRQAKTVVELLPYVQAYYRSWHSDERPIHQRVLDHEYSSRQD
jgi:cytosine/adenosine deaminase-related metal-dependent hydrolase